MSRTAAEMAAYDQGGIAALESLIEAIEEPWALRRSDVVALISGCIDQIRASAEQPDPAVQAWQAAAAAAIVGRLDCEDLCIDDTDWHVHAVDGPAYGTDRMLLIDPPEQDITVRISVEVLEGDVPTGQGGAE